MVLPGKPIIWMGSSKEDLRGLPQAARAAIGNALWIAQLGGKHASAKPLSGFGGAGVLEVVTDYDGCTFRAVYAVKIAERIYVLHVFQKKSRKGIATSQSDIKLINARLKAALEHAKCQK